MAVEKVLSLSITHLSPDTIKILESGALESDVYRFGCDGWAVPIWTESGTDRIADEDKFPTDILDAIEFAIANDCSYVFFEEGAEEIDGLDTF